ncbi:MAG: zinc-dependent peptidase, partial [Owenweeksia sp.]
MSFLQQPKSLYDFRWEKRIIVVFDSPCFDQTWIKSHQKELEEHFPYYNSLDPQNRRVFAARVQAFISNKEFVPRGYTHVNARMEAMIAGAAIQLTFGFRHLNFTHFSRILVYPDNYYSSITRKYHQGEVNLRGIIVLSWRNFVEGYSKETDGRNLGLHEMAHALRLENAISNEEFDFIDPRILKRFDELALEEMERIRSGEDFFRLYGATNLQEFFAVAVENFFERPQAFFEYNPELYTCMVQKLKQDPRQWIRTAEING